MSLYTVAFCLFMIIMPISASAEEGDLHINGYTPKVHSSATHLNYTVLATTQYKKTVFNSRHQIRHILNKLKKDKTPNTRIAAIVQQLADTPYQFIGAMGEGDWQARSPIYKPGAVHVKQDPVYRLDSLDCQTFVQVAMGLYHAKNINQFDKNYINISYGAAGHSVGSAIHYFNRNNFVDGDWNPVNERHGWLQDVTTTDPHALTTSANITRQNWFLFQQRDLATTVRVLADNNGPAMVDRFTTSYSSLNYPHFDTQTVTIAYLPKEKLAVQQPDGGYQPNQLLLNKIPTPAVVEIVRDVKKWTIGGKNIKEVIGSELNISHMGLLYRKNFHHGDIIYPKTTCAYDAQYQKVCHVTPVTCKQEHCSELMFAHATDARPMGYYWYKQDDGNFTCSANPPVDNRKFTQCNRVVQQPLFDYLIDYQYDSYLYMNSPSIVGIHIEKIL